MPPERSINGRRAINHDPCGVAVAALAATIESTVEPTLCLLAGAGSGGSSLLGLAERKRDNHWPSILLCRMREGCAGM